MAWRRRSLTCLFSFNRICWRSASLILFAGISAGPATESHRFRRLSDRVRQVNGDDRVRDQAYAVDARDL